METATKHDIKDVRGEISALAIATKAEFGEVKQEITGLKGDLRSLEVKFDAKFDALLLSVKRGFDEISERFDRSDANQNRILNNLDAAFGKKERRGQEEDVLEHQVDRHDRWIKQLAVKAKVELEYEVDGE